MEETTGERNTIPVSTVHDTSSPCALVEIPLSGYRALRTGPLCPTRKAQPHSTAAHHHRNRLAFLFYVTKAEEWKRAVSNPHQTTLPIVDASVGFWYIPPVRAICTPLPHRTQLHSSPLYPMPTIFLSWLTIQAPICELGSLDRCAERNATAMK